MSAYIDFLKDKEDTIYPITLTNSIYDTNGTKLTTILNNKAPSNHNHDNSYAAKSHIHRVMLRDSTVDILGNDNDLPSKWNAKGIGFFWYENTILKNHPYRNGMLLNIPYNEEYGTTLATNVHQFYFGYDGSIHHRSATNGDVWKNDSRWDPILYNNYYDPRFVGGLNIAGLGANEGGELKLEPPPDGTENMYGTIIDNYKGLLRIFQGNSSTGTSPSPRKILSIDLLNNKIYGSTTFTYEGTATQANKLTTARKISLTGAANGWIYFDGSKDIVMNTIFNDEVNLTANRYGDDGKSASLNLNNSNIRGVNGIYFSDLCDSAKEGLQFWRSDTTVDTIYVKNGGIYFCPNRTLNADPTEQHGILHTGNYHNYAAQKSHTHDDRYFTESEINTKLGTYMPKTGGTFTGDISIGIPTGEGGQMQILAADDRPQDNGIVIDNFYGALRFFGKASLDGKTHTGVGGTISFNPYTSQIYAPGWSFTGVSSSANKLSTARSITVGLTTKTFDGSANIAFSNKEIGICVKTAITNTDFNTVTTTGFYRINNGNSNNKSQWSGGGTDWGQMIVMHSEGDTIAQFVIQHAGDHVMLYRSGNPSNTGGGGSWSEWYEVLARPRFNPVKIQSTTPPHTDTLWAW